MGVKIMLRVFFSSLKKVGNFNLLLFWMRMSRSEMVYAHQDRSKHCIMPIGCRIREVRGKNSQDYFAQLHGIHRNTLSRWESGQRPPEYTFLQRITRHYGLSPKWVLLGEGPMFVAETPSLESGVNRALRQLEQDKLSLQADYIHLTKENHDLLKENAELRIELMEIRMRKESLEGNG